MILFIRIPFGIKYQLLHPKGTHFSLSRLQTRYIYIELTFTFISFLNPVGDW